MKPSYGFIYENKVIKELHLKKVESVSSELQDMIYTIFENISGENVIRACHCDKKEKADMCIMINGAKRFVSIKYGDKNSVHTEELKNFRKLILYNNCGWDIMEKYLRYHYADGTLDGSGTSRISVADYKLTHANEIATINEAFNKTHVLEEAYRRFLFRGIVPNGNLVDAILYCRSNARLWATRDEIIEYLDHKLFMESSGVHFSRLFVQPLARNLNYNPKHEERRHYVQIKWFDMYISLSEIEHKRKTGTWLDVIA